MADLAIQVQSVSKSYTISAVRRPYKTLRDQVADTVKRVVRRDGHCPRKESVRALSDVSFEVRQGEVVGVIGGNGAGKSTLLKILSRITRPTTGSATIYGRVGALLEVGTGFHPELTGRENIYLNGAILGMRRGEIEKKFDEVIAFAEVERFLETPVKHYSSGMYLRLAFAVAAHMEPEILLVDEVLAVGDAAFQKKCLGKMGDVAKGGRTVLFVSHNMAAVANLCQQGLVLERGRVAFSGNQTDAIAHYLKTLGGDGARLDARDDRRGSGLARIVRIEARATDGTRLDTVASGDTVDVYLHFETTPALRSSRVVASVMFKTQLDVPVFLHHSRLTGATFRHLPKTGAFVLRVPRLPLPPSTYRITYSLSADGECLDSLENAAELTVVAGDFFGSGEVPPITHGVCLVDGQWRLDPHVTPAAVHP